MDGMAWFITCLIGPILSIPKHAKQNHDNAKYCSYIILILCNKIF